MPTLAIYVFKGRPWVKYVQFCYKASEHLRKLCQCLICCVCSCYLDSAIQWHQSMQDISRDLPLPGHLSSLNIFSQLQQWTCRYYPSSTTIFRNSVINCWELYPFCSHDILIKTLSFLLNTVIVYRASYKLSDTILQCADWICALQYAQWTTFDKTTATQKWRIFSETHCITLHHRKNSYSPSATWAEQTSHTDNCA